MLCFRRGWESESAVNKILKANGRTLTVLDGNTLYFHADRTGGKGEFDIGASQKVDGEWQAPENVLAVNTEGNEGWPFLTQDGNELVYADLFGFASHLQVAKRQRRMAGARAYPLPVRGGNIYG